MESLSKREYAELPLITEYYKDIRVSELIEKFRDVIYIVEHVDNMVIKEYSSQETMDSAATIYDIAMLLTGDAVKRGIEDDSAYAHVEFVPMDYFYVDYKAGCVYTKYIQYDYLCLTDAYSIERCCSTGVSKRNGLNGVRFNKSYKQHIYWSFKTGWQGAIEVIKRNGDCYERVKYEIEGTIIGDYAERSMLYEYLRTAYRDINGGVVREYVYDRDYRRLSTFEKIVLKAHSLYYDKKTKTDHYQTAVKGHIAYMSLIDVANVLCEYKGVSLDTVETMELKWKFVDAELNISNIKRKNRVLCYNLALLGYILSNRQDLLTFFENQRYWYFRLDIYNKLCDIIDRDCISNYII